MISFNLSAFICVSLAFLCWQGSSCKNAKVKANSNNSNISEPMETRTSPSRLATGTWGGEHIRVEVNDNGASVDYDCAHGTVTEPIIVDRNGDFTAKGLHVTEHPGPVRQGEDVSGEPVVYLGHTNGESLTLTVKLAATNKIIGRFNLKHGAMGRVVKCG